MFLKLCFVILTSISRLFAFIPSKVFIQSDSSPTGKHLKATLIGTLVAFGIIVFAWLVRGVTFDSAHEFVKHQPYYKIWAIYTIFLIIGRFVAKIRRNSHLVLRGAIRSESSLIFPIIIHAFSVIFQYVHLAFVNGAYLAAFGGAKNLFTSAILHIQCVVTKKFLPKISEGNPVLNEGMNRVVALFAFIYNTKRNSLGSGLKILYFEFFFALVRYFLVAFSDENAKFLEGFEKKSKNLYGILTGKKCQRDDSLIFQIPNEAYALLLIYFIISGSFIMKLFAIAIIALFSVVNWSLPLSSGTIKEKDDGESKKDNKKKEKGDSKEEVDSKKED